MAGKTYSAGTVFLQVVPVFKDVQKAVKRQVADMNETLGDEMEKGGTEAGKRQTEAIGKELEKGAKRNGKVAATSFQREFDAAVKGIGDNLKPIDLKFQSNDVRRQIADIKKEIEGLGDTKIKTDLDAKEAEAKLRILSAQLQGLQDDVKLNAKLDIRNAAAAAARFEKQLDSLQKAADIEVRLDLKPADRAIGAFEKRMRETARKAASHLGDSINPEIRKIKAELEGIGDADIGIDIDAATALAQIEALSERARELSLMSPDIDVKVNAGRAEAELAVLTAAVRALDGKDIDLKADVDAGAAITKLGILKAMFTGSGGADAGANSFRSFNAVVLAAVTLLPALIPVIGAVGGALLALLPILGAVGAGIGAMLVGFSGIGDAVSALGAQADNAAKDTAAAARTMKSASYAVADARQGVADAERSAGQAAADAERQVVSARRSAARASIDAARQVADARRSAAESIQNALRAQKDAQDAYRDSVRDVRDAEQDLRDARKRAAQQDAADKVDNTNRLKDNALAIRQAQLDAFNATNTLNAVMADGSSTAYDKEAADLAYDQAQQALVNLRAEQKDLRAEQKKQTKEGASGTDAVRAAQDRLTAAIEAQREAHQRVGETAKAVDKARQDGARRVADAVRNQQRAEADGARAVAEAVANQRRTEADGARSIQRAHEQLRRANEAYGDALYQTGEIGSASMQKVEQAMGKLGPAGRKFARFLFGLREGFYNFRRAIQEAMLPGVQRALQAVIDAYGPRFQKFMVRMARSVGGLFEALADSLKGPAWRRFFGIMDAIAPKMLRLFGRANIKLMEAFASVMSAVAPFALQMARGISRMADAAARWAASKRGQEAITHFMQYAKKVGPAVLDFLGGFVRAAINLARAMAPWGAVVLKGLDGILNWIADMDPKTLGLITGAVLGLITAFQVAVGVTAAVLAGTAVFATVAGAVVFGVVALAAVVLAAYLRFEKFRQVVNVVAKVIGKVMSFLWDKVLKPIFKGIIWWVKTVWGAFARYFNFGLKLAKKVFSGIRDFYNRYLAPVFKVIGKVVSWLWRNIFKPYFTLIWNIVKTAFKLIKGYWTNILWPVLDLIFKIIGKLWSKLFKPVLGWIADRWHELATGMKIVWNKYVAPLLDAIGDKVLPKLKRAFRDAIDGIKTIWDGLRKIVGAPIKFVIETVLNNGLIKGFNKIATFAGSKKIDPIDVPKWTYATGGVFGRERDQEFKTGGTLPGYTPGRDVHHFSSPTGGNLHLSGGEAIMRPEVTAAVGSGWVDRVNAAARRGGVSAVRQLMQGGQAFAKGGIFFPLPGAHKSTYKNHDGVDLNVGSGSDDLGMPFYSATSGRVWDTGYEHGYGNAVFVDSPYGRLVYGHSLDGSIRVNVGQEVKPGTWLARVGSTGNSSAPHLHFGFPGGTYEQAVALLAGAPIGSPGKAGGSGLPGWLQGIIGKPMEWAKDLYGKATGELAEKFGNSQLISTVVAVGKTLLSPLVDKITGMFGSRDDGDSITPEVASGNIYKAVQGVAAQYGWARGAEWRALSEIISRESGWNPSAANPDSSARGLFQKMTSIHGAIEGTVEGQARWGLDYIKGRYGDPLGALAFHDSHGYYKDGGVLPGGSAGESPAAGAPAYNGTMMYDSGGYLPPGLTTVMNLTGKPEPVFTAEQFKQMGEGGGRGGAGIHYEPHFEGSDLTSSDVMQDFEFTWRKMSRLSAGRYDV